MSLQEEILLQKEAEIGKLNEENQRLKDKIQSLEKVICKNERKIDLNLKFSDTPTDVDKLVNSISDELIEYQQYNEDLIKSESIQVNYILVLITKFLKNSFSDFTVSLYGSYATNSCLNKADIDILLLPNNSNSTLFNDEVWVKRGLSLILYKLQSQEFHCKSELVVRNSVPQIYLMLSEKYNNYVIWIAIESSKSLFTNSTNLTKTFLKRYPTLKPLIITFKRILKDSNLMENGVNGFALVLIIVSFLQTNEKLKDLSNLGQIFLDTLYYYGFEFEYSKFAVITYVEDRSFNDIKIESKFLSNSSFLVVNPLNTSSNVIDENFNYQKIQVLFSSAYLIIGAQCDCSSHYDSKYKDMEFQHSYLKRIFNLIK